MSSLPSVAGTSLSGRSTAGTSSAIDEQTPFERATVLLAQVVVVVVGIDHALRPGVSVTLLVAAGLAPLWVASLRRFRFAAVIAALAVLAVGWGVALSERSAIDHAVSRSNQVQAIGLLLGGIVAIGLVLWAREHLPLHRVAVLYGLGAMIGAVSEGNLSWKYHLAVPVVFVVLGSLGARPTPIWSAAAAVGIGALAVADEGRSVFALCLLTALLTIWYAPRRGDAPDRGTWAPLVMLAAATLVMYLLGTALLTGGYLGAALQERSIDQVETTGSLIAGGRPEWAATRALISMRPEGYGVGVVPSWTDYRTGASGLSAIDLDTGGYAKHYLFGDQFRLHSVAADLWVSYGIVGVALAIALLVALVRSLATSLATGARAVVVFACLLGLWYLLFGPIFSNWLDVCVAVALAVRARDHGTATGPS